MDSLHEGELPGATPRWRERASNPVPSGVHNQVSPLHISCAGEQSTQPRIKDTGDRKPDESAGKATVGCERQITIPVPHLPRTGCQLSHFARRQIAEVRENWKLLPLTQVILFPSIYTN